LNIWRIKEIETELQEIKNLAEKQEEDQEDQEEDLPIPKKPIKHESSPLI